MVCFNVIICFLRVSQKIYNYLQIGRDSQKDSRENFDIKENSELIININYKKLTSQLSTIPNIHAQKFNTDSQINYKSF